jgi:hypothetical protein
MPTYSTRFSGQRDARKYRDAGFRARQLNAGSRGYNTVSPIYSPGVLQGLPQQASADTWQHQQAKIQNAREADLHSAAVLGLDTQNQQNRLAQIESDLRLAREGYPTSLGGNPAAPAMQPPKPRAAAPAAQAPGLAPRPVDKGMVEAGLMLNNPMATPVQKEWAQQAIALKKAQLGAQTPVQPAMTPPATAQGTAPAMQPPQFRGTPADVARQEAAWRQNQAELGMRQTQLGMEGERVGLAKTQSVEAVETSKQNRELAKADEARRVTAETERVAMNNATLNKTYTPESVKAFKAGKGDLVENRKYSRRLTTKRRLVTRASTRRRVGRSTKRRRIRLALVTAPFCACLLLIRVPRKRCRRRHITSGDWRNVAGTMWARQT